MSKLDVWPDAPALQGQQVRLEPLRVEHARELGPLLDDPDLHLFTGGRPVGAVELKQRYRRQVMGRSPDGSQRWLNWVVRRLDDGRPGGTLQATVAETAGGLTAEVAWIVASAHQRLGYGRDAAQVMVAWLRRQGIGMVIAHIHPEHEASAAIARAVGLAPTAILLDGEVRWQS